MEDLRNWTPRPAPDRVVLDGRYVRLEPLDPIAHGDDLFRAATTPDADQKFAWLFELPPTDKAEFVEWLTNMSASADPLFFSVIDKASGAVAGRQTLMRIDRNFGVIEIGNILWGAPVARRPAATEALYLFASYVFDVLGYRRFEWKCNNENEPSKRAAARFGFRHEGVFRQHMVVKGRNRDTSWWAMIDKDWPSLQVSYDAWLDPDNFDSNGQQIKRLAAFRAENGA
jgi:RimJ/RimL family protein N-acetyltransferase